MRPAAAAQQLPSLPAYILFMCVRYTDYMNYDDKVRSLLTNTINCIKKIVQVMYCSCHTFVFVIIESVCKTA